MPFSPWMEEENGDGKEQRELFFIKLPNWGKNPLAKPKL